MLIRFYDIEEIKPYESNPRINDKAVEIVKRSIEEFGFLVPILIDEKMEIVSGHTRYKAAIELEYETVPCILINNLTDAQIKTFRIADNKSAEYSDWDYVLLEEELALLRDMKFDLELTLFEADELEKLLDEMVIVEEDEYEPELPEEPYSRKGDLWILGKHRLYCGDSIDENDLDILMNGHKAKAVITDPPYLMGFEGNVHGDGSKSFNSKHGEILNDKMSREDGDKFIAGVFESIKSYNTGAFYVFFYRLGLDYIFRALDHHKLKHRSVIIWDKGNHTLSMSDYMSRYEPIIYGWIQEHTFYGPKNEVDIWDIARTKKNDLHPTMKPLAVLERAIRNSTRPGDLVLDLFGGSGSTLIAADQLGRCCNMMELNPKYIDVIVKRFLEYKKSGDNIYLIRERQKIPLSEIEL